DIVPDALARGVGLVAQERLRRHEDARRAKPALQGVVKHERALQLLDLARIGQALDRVYLAAVGLRREHEAGAHDFAVDAHRAGAAHAVLAADVGAGELELVPEEVGEVEPRGHAALHSLAVHGERDLDGFERRVHGRSCLSTRPARTLARWSLVAAEACRSPRGARSSSSFARATSMADCPSRAFSNPGARKGRSPTPNKATRIAEK